MLQSQWAVLHAVVPRRAHPLRRRLGALILPCSPAQRTRGPLQRGLGLGAAYALRVISLLELIDVLDTYEARFTTAIADQLRGHVGYHVIQQLPGVGPVLDAVFVAEIGDAQRFSGPDQLCSWAGLTHATTSRTPSSGVDTSQAGQPTGPLGGGRGHPAPTDRHEDLPRSCTHRGPPRQEHRQGRRGPQAAHPRLLRPARRAHPRPGPAEDGGVSTPDAARARPQICLIPASRRDRAS